MPPKWMSKYLINHGHKHFQQQEYTLALTAFDLAVAADPDSEEAHLGMANTCQVLHRYDEAIHHYTVAFILNPQNADTLMRRGTVYHLSWRLADAINDFTQAARLSPQIAAAAYLARGTAYGHMNNYNEALRDFESVIGLQPKNPDAYFYHGLALIRLGCYNEAVASLNKSLHYNPDHALANQLVGELTNANNLPSQKNAILGKMKIFQDVQGYMNLYPIH